MGRWGAVALRRQEDLRDRVSGSANAHEKDSPPEKPPGADKNRRHENKPSLTVAENPVTPTVPSQPLSSLLVLQ